MDAIEGLLPGLLEQVGSAYPNTDDLLHNARGNQPLHILQPSPIFYNDQSTMQIPQQTSEGDTDNRNLLSSLVEDNSTFPALYITCFGRFEVRRLGKSIDLCSSRNGQIILHYL